MQRTSQRTKTHTLLELFLLTVSLFLIGMTDGEAQSLSAANGVQANCGDETITLEIPFEESL